MDRNIAEYGDFEQCIKCTVCTAYCPVLPVNPLFPGPKQAGPDGERLRLKNGFFYDENLKYCMNCKRCESACPSGVKIADIIHAARRRYNPHNPSFRDALLADTDSMGKIASPIAHFVNATLELKGVRLYMDRILDIDRRRTFPRYQKETFTKWFVREAEPRQGAFSKSVAYFHGCSTQWQHPIVGKAFVRVMNALGYGVKLLPEKCCGVAMISNGLFSHARKNALYNISIMQEAVLEGLPIVTTSSTCTLTMRDEYPGVLALDNSTVRDEITLAEKFIYSVLERGEAQLVVRKDFKARVAYHVPCHMEKLGWGIFTRYLLEKIPGLDLTLLPSSCCGIAGTYGFKKENYVVSQMIGQPLFDAIKALSPDYVTSECETCKWQIEMSTGFKVVNPIVVLADAMGLLDEGVEY